MTLPAVTNSVLQAKFDKAVKKLQEKQIIKNEDELVVNALNWYIDNLYKNKVIN